MEKKAILSFIALAVIVVGISAGCIEEATPPQTPTPIPAPTQITTPTSGFEEEFIDKYVEAEEMFYKISNESELEANKSINLADEYYDSGQYNKAREKYQEAAELYSKAREQNLEVATLFEGAYEIAPIEDYKELCMLYINASQSYSKLMNYMSSATEHLEKACDYYEREDYIRGNEEVKKQGRDIMRYNIERETYITIIEKITEIEYR